MCNNNVMYSFRLHKMFRILYFSLVLFAVISCGRNPNVAPYGTYTEGLLGSIEAKGWIGE